MAPIDHAVASEELMAYLDGELSRGRAGAIHNHLAECAACQNVAAQLQHVSRDLATWKIEPPPGMRPPVVAAAEKPAALRWTSMLRTPAFAWSAGVAVVVLLAAGTIWNGVGRSRRPAVSVTLPADVVGRFEQKGVVASARGMAAPAPVAQPHAMLGGEAAPAVTAPVPAQKIIRTVELTIVTKDLGAVRPQIDRILRDLGGFAGQIDASGDRDTSRSLTATLRIPATRVDDAVRALSGLGRVVHESQSADDVAEQVLDIEARLANSRNTEKRLNDVLKNRTGDVADVLQVEREIARVREEVERLDAERTNLERRVTYATVTLRVTEERQATLEIGPVPLRLQLRNALVDGLRDAASGVTDLLLWALRAGPTLLLWVAVLWWPARRLLRAWRHPRTATT